MMMAWYFFQTILIFALLGWGAYATMKKLQKNQFSKTGQKGQMEVLDGLNLNHRTSAYLVSVEGQQLFVVVGEGGTNTTILRDKKFQDLMNEGLEEVAPNEN